MTKYKLKGHEKFPLREGWLNKGILGVEKQPKIFSGTEGTDNLGVGSNMVKAIRYWMQSFELITENSKTGAKLTDLATIIRNNDEFFEDYFTLWVLHSQIAKNAGKATIWYLFFNKILMDEFNKNQIFTLLRKELVAYVGHDEFPDNSLKDDIDVLLNMYSKNIGIDDPEDKNRCPFATLGLLKKDGNDYIKQQPELRKFDDLIILYEIVQEIGTDKSVSIEHMAMIAENIYHLSRVNVNGILDRLDNSGYIRVDRTAGLDMIYLNKRLTANQVLEEYYCNR